jgi:NADH-ubiquinone oxidoreductase chain 5
MFFIIVAAFTKRAQIPFSAWLPAAIAAPTPVSALVHSSTLVTAGVYILIRYWEYMYTYLNFAIIFISSLTTIIAGVCANYEKDLKKIIALSTLSQLGVIIFIIGVGDVLVGYYHILIHAIFKALLFLCAGGYIHSLKNYQDIRYIRGLGGKRLFFSFGFLGCRIALIGFPFLAGFYSKDLICEYMLIGKLNLIFCFLFLIGIGLTRMYRIKVILIILGDKQRNLEGYVGERKKMVKRIFILLLGTFLNGAIIG